MEKTSYPQPGSLRWNIRTWYLRTKRHTRNLIKRYDPRRLNYSRITDIEVDGVDTSDYPDFCDAYICSANYKTIWGTYRELTEDELERLNEDSSFVYDQVIDRLF